MEEDLLEESNCSAPDHQVFSSLAAKLKCVLGKGQATKTDEDILNGICPLPHFRNFSLKRAFCIIFTLKKPCLKVQILQYQFLDEFSVLVPLQEAVANIRKNIQNFVIA